MYLDHHERSAWSWHNTFEVDYILGTPTWVWVIQSTLSCVLCLGSMYTHATFTDGIHIIILDDKSWDAPSFFGFIPYPSTAILNIVVQKSILQWQWTGGVKGVGGQPVS